MPKTALLVGTHALCLLGGGLLLHLLPAPSSPDSGKPAEAPTKSAEHPAVDPLAAEGAKIAARAVSRARAFPAFYDPAEALRLANEIPPGGANAGSGLSRETEFSQFPTARNLPRPTSPGSKRILKRSCGSSARSITFPRNS